jgi:hypothetical protein
VVVAADEEASVRAAFAALIAVGDEMEVASAAATGRDVTLARRVLRQAVPRHSQP